MARSTPRVQDGDLRLTDGDGMRSLRVGTPAWFTWLDGATTFAFAGPDGGFTARREAVGHGRGGRYWKAYRQRDGRLRRAYLGRSEDLTLARLAAAAAALAGRTGGDPDAPPTNLPAALTSFVGREGALAELAALLPTTRLLTLAGAGGVGKTRLALETARAARAAYPDGVWLVDLAPLADPLLVEHAVAAALHVAEQPGRPLLETLTGWLAGKRLLLLLDNCEHLLDACAALAHALLRGCPDLRILATSREPLAVAGETTWRVPSLALPDRSQSPTVAALTRVESARLFVERARAVQPAFAVTEQNAAAIGEICRRLDGIPLALELAAARLRALSVGQIAARLDDRFRLLTGGGRTDLPRQRTLRATVDWSHDLLTEAERALFRRLAVFAGGFALDEAEAVGAGPDDPALGADAPALDLLARLVDQSLVQVEADEDAGEPRYRLLETLRHYARERLTASGEVESARDRHARCFLALAEALEEQRWGGQEAAWAARLGRDFDNLRAALAWAAERGEGEVGLRIGGAVYLLWIHRGQPGEGRAVLARALAGGAGRGAARPARLARAKALHGLGVLAREQGGYAAAAAAFAESLAIRREEGDRRGAALTLENLGRVVEARGEVAAARASFEESLALFRELGDRRGMGGVLHSLGYLAWQDGDTAAARALLEESLALERETDDVAYVHGSLGRLLCALGDVAAARPLLLEDAARLRAMGSRGLIAWQALDNLACLATAEGKPARALRLGGAAEALREQAGLQLPPGELAQLERLLAPARRALGVAAGAAAWADGRMLTVEQAAAYALDDASLSSAAERTLPAAPPTPNGLSRREVEVLRLLAAGRSNREVAEELSVSVRTVERHITNLYGKIDARNRADATAFAIRHGLA